MAITAVHDWLTVKGPFAKGLELLKAHRDLTSTEAFLFAQGDKPFPRQKLVDALTSLNKAATERVLARPTPLGQAMKEDVATARSFERAIKSEAGKDLPESSLPAALQPLRGQLRDMHRHLVHLRATLLGCPDGIELRNIAERIVDLRFRINSGWRVIEEWRATGVVAMPKEAPPPVGQNDLVRELNSLNVQLSKAKYGKSKAGPDKVAIWEARKQAIKSILNGTPETE